MKNNMSLGLLAFAMLASMSFAQSFDYEDFETLDVVSYIQPIDYDNYVRTGGCLRYIGPEVVYPYMVFPSAHPDEYREVEFNQIVYMREYTPSACPKENGIPVCLF